MPMVAVEVTRRRSPPEPKTASSLPVTSCRALTSKPLPIISAAHDSPRLGGLAVDPHVSLNGSHALLRGGLRERALKRRGQTDSGGQGEQCAAALNAHAGKSTLTKLPAVPGHAQSSRAGNQSLSPAARGESRRLASLGRRGALPRARGGQADPALGRIFRLPLVPRHGARVLRGPGSGRGDESPVRERQGGPGGTSGS